MEDIVLPFRDKIIAIAASHGAHNVRVYGSVARGEARPDSDIDFLVDFDKGRSLFDLVGLKEDLESLLGRPSDVGEPEGLHWSIKKEVLREAIEL